VLETQRRVRIEEQVARARVAVARLPDRPAVQDLYNVLASGFSAMQFSVSCSDGWSPEHGPTEDGVSYSQQIVWDLFSNYVAAMNHGLKRLREGFPLSLRLFREMHTKLLAQGRGSGKNPGEFRTTQNWIGGTRPGTAAFVPPPPQAVLPCMNALELFLHDRPEPTPILLKAALAHVQFETIHPFLDGNGRLGRLLITFLLCAEGALREPLLYLSLYFKQHRQRYYELLQSVRLTGDWEAWLRFFLTGVAETAAQAADTARALMNLAAADEKRIQAIGKAAGSALRVHRMLQAQPLISIASASKQLNLTFPTVTASLKHLEKLGIVRETTGSKYGRLYAYER